MVWRLPARTARAASQVRCQRGSELGKRGAGPGSAAAAGRASEGRKAAAEVRAACLRKARRGELVFIWRASALAEGAGISLAYLYNQLTIEQMAID
jgi:hypothetical protein